MRSNVAPLTVKKLTLLLKGSIRFKVEAVNVPLLTRRALKELIYPALPNPIILEVRLLEDTIFAPLNAPATKVGPSRYTAPRKIVLPEFVNVLEP